MAFLNNPNWAIRKPSYSSHYIVVRSVVSHILYVSLSVQILLLECRTPCILDVSRMFYSILTYF